MLHVLRPFILAFLVLAAPQALAQTTVVDLAGLATDSGELMRAHGSTGTGVFGVPIASGNDCDGDGRMDTAMAAMTADPMGRNNAGEVYLVFGDGTILGTRDTAGFDADILKIAGDGDRETAGSEIWMDDVTGDGLGDLLICRQNFSPTLARRGAGALSIVVGGASLRTHAATLSYLDLRSPPPGITVTTLVGNGETDRLCIWARTGDITGDGIADLAIGADQEDLVATHGGAVYVVRGGAHLAGGGTIDFADFGTTSLAGHVARITPPASSTEFHFGATVQIADLDGNGRGEVLAAAALNRAGAILAPTGNGGPTHASGGSDEGTLYIAWDDNFPAGPWVPGYAFAIDAAPGSTTVLDGGADNVSFGEEILGGLDYDRDGKADLFIGDLVASPPGRSAGGLGHVLYRAEDLKGVVADYDSLPPGMLTPTDLLGAESGNIAADTAMHGDFDGDGADDLAVGSPHGNPQSRREAGIIDILHGQTGGWPATIDLADPAVGFRLTQIQGARGEVGDDAGDTLCYSGTAADVDADGLTDVITNEMVGNGIAPSAEDVGNLLVISGEVSGVFADGFESGDTSAWQGGVQRMVLPEER